MRPIYYGYGSWGDWWRYASFPNQLRNFLRHILEGLHVRPPKYPKGEPFYSPLSTRWFHFKRGDRRIRWLITGY